MIIVVDYGASNLASVKKALEYVGLEVVISRDPDRITTAQGVVFPGQGGFGSGSAGLQERGLVEPLREYIAADRPFLGICLGLQLLFDSSEESPGVTGLGVFEGSCAKFRGAGLTVPHIGWNQIRYTHNTPSPWMAGIANEAHFYFVHSYYPVPTDPAVVVTTTDYGPGFVSMVARGRVAACQFHPEKSQAMGIKLLENFKRICQRG